MPNFRNIWRNSTRRSRAIFVGGTGIGALLMTFAPIWDGVAGAVPAGGVQPSTGNPGDPILVTITSGCVNATQFAVDVVIEFDTDSNDSVSGESPAEAQPFPFEADGTYVVLAPAELDRLEGDAAAGPDYPVIVTCFDHNPPTLSAEDIEAALVSDEIDTFTYFRASTTSSSAPTTSSTSSSTTTTTIGGTTSTSPTTSSTTPSTSSTTSTTIAGTTTSTTGATTTSTTTGATTTSTTIGATTTSTTAGGGTTTSTAPSSTSSSSSVPGGTLPPATLGTSSTSSTIAGGGTSSTSPSSSSTTAAPGCTVSDTTPLAGSTVAVTCGGFAAGSPVNLDLLSDPVRLATATANASGVVSSSVQIPLNTSAGSHEIRLTGTSPSGTQLVKSIPITVEKTLPRTGANTWNIFRVALLLVGIGLVGVGRSQLLLARD